MNRRNFFESSTALGLSLAAGSLITGSLITGSLTTGSARAQSAPPKAPPERKRPNPLASDQVEAFVRAAHGNLDQVQAMLAEQPALVNATWDWGGGDFETALGGASHMGNRPIALHLLKSGARMDLFAATMLGQLPIVRAAIEIDPSLLHVPGPHNIPLIVHAKKGGEEAAAVLAYLEGLNSA